MLTHILKHSTIQLLRPSVAYLKETSENVIEKYQFFCSCDGILG